MLNITVMHLSSNPKLEALKCFWFKLSLDVVITCRPSNDGTTLTFSKFEEKKNTEKGRRINTVRRLFWGSPSPQKRQGPFEYSQFHRIEKGSVKCLSLPFYPFCSGTSCITEESKSKLCWVEGTKALIDDSPYSQPKFETLWMQGKQKQDMKATVLICTLLRIKSHDPTKFGGQHAP